MSSEDSLNAFTPNQPGNQRQATWLEVFFDLVFAVTVTQLARYLHQHLGTADLIKYAALFIPIWWAWTGFSYFFDLFDTNDKTYFRVILLIAMLVVLALALNTRDALTTTSFSFAACYTVLQGLLISLYVWARRDVDKTKKLCNRFITGFSAGAALWLSSLFVEPPARFTLWGLALAVEIATPLVAYLSVANTPVHGSHLPYRLGQFTMIVLGETVAAVATGVADTNWQLSTIFTAINGFAIAVCFWWLYFSDLDRTNVDRALRSNNKELFKSFIYGYGHIAIFAGIAATGVGIELAISSATEQTFSARVPLPLFYGAATALFGMTLVHSVRSSALPLQRAFGRIAMAGLAILLATFSHALTSEAAIVCFVLPLIATTFLEEFCS
ncbi:MAG: low temperature requirement protein A [Cyanophyceae cyanobacterium]